MGVGSGDWLGLWGIENLHGNTAARIDNGETIADLGRYCTTKPTTLSLKSLFFLLGPRSRRGVADIKVGIKRSGPAFESCGDCIAYTNIRGVDVADIVPAVMPERPAVIVCH